MKGLSLFSGIGGLDLAFEWAGGEVAGMCEIEPYCRKILQKHWPDVPLYGDVKELRGEDIGAVDIIYGGFPCQPFSVAGKQKGRDDCRYLWPEFSRLVGEIRPRWVVGENVPGILHIAADDVCADLEQKGYSVGIFDFEAAAVGAPHRRERFFFVAHARRGMRTGCTIPGKICGEHEAGKTVSVERPGGASVPNSDNIRRNDRGVEKHSIHGEKSTLDDAKTSSQASADSDSERCEEQRSPLTAPEELSCVECCRRWGPEPGVGGIFDGLSEILDGGRLNDDAKARAFEILRNLRPGTLSEAIQWTLRRFHGVSKSEVLFAFLCEYEEGCYRSGAALESGANEGVEVRNLWRTIEFARSSHRRGYSAQYAREYSNALCKLSCEASSLMPQAWENGCWEDGIPRTANNIPHRVDRLRALGNSVVPQQAYPIFRAIMKQSDRTLDLY